MDSGAARKYDRPVIEWHGNGGELFKIFLVNLILTLLTLGIYRFWGKTQIRRYLWSHTSFEGERLEYTGTGKELFLGFLIVVFVILVPLFGGMAWLQFYLEANDPALLPQLGFLQSMIIFYLIPVAIYRARRYRLSRTRWRGIRGAQTGSALAYGGMTLSCYFLAALTLGLTLPLVRTLLLRYKLNNTLFGDRRLRFGARPGPLYKPFLWVFGSCLGIFILIVALMGFLAGFRAALFLSAPEAAGVFLAMAFIPLIILPWYFYKAAEYRYFAGQTRYEGLVFSSDVTGWQLIRLYVGNLFILVFTLGLGRPVVYIRMIRFLSRHLTMSGAEDYSAIIQSALEMPATGEGLADAFDVGEF